MQKIIKTLPYLIERASTINDLVDASTWLKNNYELSLKKRANLIQMICPS